MTSLYKSASAREEIIKLYEDKLGSLGITCTSKTVNTSFGATHVLVSGDSRHPPLIIVHGSNGCAPISLQTYPNLSKHFQVFAVDVLTQPNKSAETRLSMKDDAYGAWMNEVIDSLQLKNVVLVGFSLGGLVILKTLEHNEENIKEVFLAAPAYIVNGNPLKALWKIFIPMRRFMASKKLKFVEQFLSELFTDHDEFAVEYLSKVFLNFKMDFSPVPVISSQSARGIKTPITIIAAKKDIMFPGPKMLDRAKKIFPSLKQSILLEDAKHVPGRADNSRIEALIFEAK